MRAYRQRDYQKAIEQLSPVAAAGETAPQYREAVAALGLSYYYRHDCTKALPLLELAGSWSAGNVEFPYVLGLCHLRKRDAEGARRAFARMFGVPAGSAKARLLTAQFMMRERLEDMAADELRRAVEQDPTLPQAHFILGELAIYRADPDIGIAELQKEIDLNPGFSMAYYRLGDAYTRKEMWSQAVAPLQKAIWLNPNFSSPYILLGKVYYQQGQQEFAEGLLKRALSMDPNNGQAHYQLGLVYRKTDRPGDAKKEFELWRKLQE